MWHGRRWRTGLQPDGAVLAGRLPLGLVLIFGHVILTVAGASAAVNRQALWPAHPMADRRHRIT